MRYLFVHQSFPAQYKYFLEYLAQQNTHEIVFITANDALNMRGVRKVLYQPPEVKHRDVHPFLVDFDYAVRRAESVSRVAVALKSLGYIPDIIIGHHGWGELLNLPDVFPDVPILGYFEFYYGMEGRDVNFDSEFVSNKGIDLLIRCKNSINLQALELNQNGQTPTLFQKGTYPEWAQKHIHLLPEGVDLDYYHPLPSSKGGVIDIAGIRISPQEKLVTYSARDLEPYRGFHSMMRALPYILQREPNSRIIIIGKEGVSYGCPPDDASSWREKLVQELGDHLDMTRIHFVGWLSRDDMRSVLQRSDAHIYLTYPFVLSWSLREAMAVGCALVASDTAPVREVLEHNKTALLVPFFRPEIIANAVLKVLQNKVVSETLQRNVRKHAEKTLCLKDYLEKYDSLVQSLVQ